MAETPENTIEVSRLVKTYGSLTAVNDLSFTVKKGEIVGLLGPNGAGKSTTMRILTGYLPATSGSVSICGHPVATAPELSKRHVGYMPENNPLPDDMRVSEYLWFRGRLKEMPRAKLRARIDEVLELCDLKRNRHRILGRLSKGNKQRVGIAEAILSEPNVIIMDEPTIGLDPHQILIVRDLIASLRGRMSVIISSHILPEIEATCDRVLIINGGRIVAQGSPAELRHQIFGHTSYDLEFAGDISALSSYLKTIEPTLRVGTTGESAPDGFCTVTLVTESTEDLGEKILHTLPAHGYRLRSLRRTQPSLEDVFLAATRRSWDARLPDKKNAGDVRAPLPKV
ncbi:ATP-binding cassette domain-containing protein [Oleiharenicola lentus]|uniref:ABC transporter ATP-binding protein n=1 Tax=Oleiharenicola lentus TaxID=2508720 RepID=UPI003F67FFB8